LLSRFDGNARVSIRLKTGSIESDKGTFAKSRVGRYARRRPVLDVVRGAPQEAPAPRRSGTTVAQSTRITGSPSIEHLA
jgi:hypothetical protein